MQKRCRKWQAVKNLADFVDIGEASIESKRQMWVG